MPHLKQAVQRVKMVPTSTFFGLTASALLMFAPSASAHTWADQLNLIAPNGSFTGEPGYPRGFVPRLPDVDPTASENVYMLPPDGRTTGNAILESDLMCKDTQMPGSSDPKYPQLNAYPGAQVAVRYQENGHVTQPWLAQKGIGGGVVYVYGTTESKASDTYLGIHKVWTADSSPGRLLTTQYFDDGQCYEASGNNLSSTRMEKFAHEPAAPMGGNLWCQTDVSLPTDIDSKTYTLYWVWDWPSVDQSGKVTLNQSYTSCIDLAISAAPNNDSSKVVAFVKDQDLNYAAISAQLATPYAVDPTAKQILNTGWMSGASQATPVYTLATTAAFTSESKSSAAVITNISLTSTAYTASAAKPTSATPSTLSTYGFRNSSATASTSAGAIASGSGSLLPFNTMPFTISSVLPFTLAGNSSATSASAASNLTGLGAAVTVTVTDYVTTTVAPVKTVVAKLRIRGRARV